MIKMRNYGDKNFEREKQRFIAMYTIRTCMDCNTNTFRLYCDICYDKNKYHKKCLQKTK